MPANEPAGTGAVIGIHDHDIAAAPAEGRANVEPGGHPLAPIAPHGLAMQTRIRTDPASLWT